MCKEYEHDFSHTGTAKLNGKTICLTVWGDCFYRIVQCKKCGLLGRQLFSNKHPEITDFEGKQFIG